MLQAKEIQVAALKAMKKREEQVKLLERTTRRTLSLHLDGWRRVVAEARSERLLKEKDAEIDRLLKALTGGLLSTLAAAPPPRQR